MAEVVGTKVSDSEISAEIDLGIEDLPSRIKARVKRDVGEFLVEQTLLQLQEASTPVKGAKFKKTLSKEYKKEKEAAGRGTTANLEFDGDLKDSLTFKVTDSGIKIGHFDDQAPKADGHNNFSGESKLPSRRYLPKEGEQYKSDIQSEIEKIVADAVIQATPIKEAELKKVETRTEFWSLLLSKYEGLSRSEVKSAVMRNEELVELIRAFGFLAWLK